MTDHDSIVICRIEEGGAATVSEIAKTLGFTREEVRGAVENLYHVGKVDREASTGGWRYSARCG